MVDAQQASVFSRRKAILTGAGLVAAGAVGGLATAELAAASPQLVSAENPTVPVMVHLRDVPTGRFDVFFGDTLVSVVDINFAAKLAEVATTVQPQS